MNTNTNTKFKGGSFMNHLMGQNQSTPKVGWYANELHYSDRDVYLVKSVSKCGKKAVLEYLETKADTSNGPLVTGHQSWVHEPMGVTLDIAYLWGSWKKVCRVMILTEDEDRSKPITTYEKFKVIFSQESQYYYDWEF